MERKVAETRQKAEAERIRNEKEERETAERAAEEKEFREERYNGDLNGARVISKYFYMRRKNWGENRHLFALHIGYDSNSMSYWYELPIEKVLSVVDHNRMCGCSIWPAECDECSYMMSGSPKEVVDKLYYRYFGKGDEFSEIIKILEPIRQNIDVEPKKGCYVATCVYGSYDCPQVWTLRRFRDNTLGSTWYGRLLIKTYNAISPTLVKWFGKTAWFKNMWKPTLDKMVSKLQAKGVESSPYEDKMWR